MAASPLKPVGSVAARFGPVECCGEQAADLAGGERDEAGLGRRRGVRPCWRRAPGVGAIPEKGGGDGADRQGSHDQHGVAEDRGVKPGLTLVQAEAALCRARSSPRWLLDIMCIYQSDLAEAAVSAEDVALLREVGCFCGC